MGRNRNSETTRRLLAWFGQNKRPLPWRRSRDPYRIWVAEVLLQQTRVAVAKRYFDRFLRAFPTVHALARAPLDDVLKAWEGAGYYARARNLQAAAQLVDGRLGGRFPRDVTELQTLPGVGPYISRAIASIAFDQPAVALDANGLRIAARLFLEKGEIRLPAVRRRLLSRAEKILPADRPGQFNEALMELGETVCLPRNPRCPICPVQISCRAYHELDDPGTLPARREHPTRPHIVAVIVAVKRRGRWLVRRRPPRSLLGGLWEFPGGKPLRGESLEGAARRELREETGLRATRLDRVGKVGQVYSHFAVELHVFSADAAGRARPESSRAPIRWVTNKEFGRLARPKATIKAVHLLDDWEGRERPKPTQTTRGRKSS